HSTAPPRRWGGNIDCKELVAGTILLLPVPVDGALFSAGDGHAAQGDGEISGTAIETPARAQLTLDLQDDLVLEWPCARIDGAWLAFGFVEAFGFAVKAEDDPLVEIQTDKTTVEIPSPAAGKVARILVAEGEVVPVGTVLVVIGEDETTPQGQTQGQAQGQAQGQSLGSAQKGRVRATPL